MSTPLPLAENLSPLREWSKEDPWLSMEFDQVNVLWNDPRWAVIPEEYAMSYQDETLAKHLFAFERDERLLYSDCGDKKLLYVMGDNLYYALRSKYAAASLEHLGGRILNWYCDPNMPQDLLVVDHGDYLQIMLRDGEKLQFAQSFPYETVNEAAYFILNTMDKLNVDRNTATLRTLGVAENAPLHEALDPFVRYIKSVNLPITDSLKEEHWLHPLLSATL